MFVILLVLDISKPTLDIQHPYSKACAVLRIIIIHLVHGKRSHREKENCDWKHPTNKIAGMGQMGSLL